MSAFSIKGSFDGTEIVNGFKDVKDGIDEVTDAGKSAKKSLGEMLKDKNSTTNYKRQLSQITAELTDLTVNFNRLTQEEKKSEFGQAMAQRIEELTGQAQELKASIDSVSASIKGTAADLDNIAPDFGAQWSEIQKQTEQTRAKFESIQKISTGVASGFAAIQGAAALLGKDSENLQKALLKVQSAMAIAQGIGGIKDLIEGISQAKVAFKAMTSATKGATIAQKALNAVMKANPYVLLASAIAAAGVALVAFAKDNKEAEEAEKKHKEALEKAAEAAQEWRDKVSSAISGPLSQYKLLQGQYNSLRTEHEKRQWIINNQRAFEDLGLSVKNLKSAEDAFVNNTGNVVQALIKRAEAAAKQQQLTELAGKYMDAKLRGEQEYQNKQKKFGDKVYSSSHDSRTGDEFIDRNGNWVYTEQGAKKANATIKKQAMAEAEAIMAQMTRLAEDLAKDMPKSTYSAPTSSSTPSSSSSGDKKEEVKYPFDSLKYWQAEVQYLQEQLSTMSPNTQEFDELTVCLWAAKDEVQAIQDLLATPVQETNLGENIADNLNKNLDKAKTELELFDEKYMQTMQEIDGYSSVFSSLGNMMSSFAEGTDEATAQWLNFGANTMNTVAQVLPQIASLIAANQAQAIAGGTASAASLPFPANIAAVASVVASLIALFASLPKFASGGIVSGSSYIGDMNLARVNSGEMILNNRQQSNLFNMLDKNRLPYSGSNAEVQFRIQGDTLVGVLDNYTKKRGRL